METMTTAEYPIRYVAKDNQQTWVEHKEPKHRGGFEFAVYSQQVQNPVYSSLTDGIFIEVVSYQGDGRLLLSCHLTIPDAHRKQYNHVKICPTYQEAKAAAFLWLKKAKGLLTKSVLPGVLQ